MVILTALEQGRDERCPNLRIDIAEVAELVDAHV